MDPFTLKVPESRDTDSWIVFTILSLELTSLYDDVCVDFGTINFLEPDDFVVLACILESFSQNGASFTFKGGTAKLNTHLDNIKFKIYWSVGFDRENYTESYNRSTFCLWKISQPMIDNYSTEARKYFSNTFFKEYDLYPLSLSLVEVFNNVFDHSNSPVTGYVMIQYYSTTKVLSFSVCDLGVGIPKKVNEQLALLNQPLLDDHEAIEKAFEVGFSSGTPRNKGLGLGTILNQAKGCNGKLAIISNKGTSQYIHNNKKQTESAIIRDAFPGTIFKVELDTTKFDLFDKDDEIYDFELF